MNINIHAGMRVLYKQGNNNWKIGTISETNAAEVNTQGVWLPVVPINVQDEIHFVEINNIYTDAVILDDWMKTSLCSKEDYIKIIQSEDFHRSTEVAWVSDGEYYYYPISKFNENWIMKQPFEYILRSN